MDKENNSQLELFSQGKAYGNTKSGATHKSFLGYIRGYEKTLLLIFAFITTVIVSFSLGVEKGKRTQIANSDTHLDLALKAQPAAVKIAPVPAANKPQYQPQPPKLPAQPVLEKPNAVPQQGNQEYIHNYYTIQLASYQNKTSAQKEAEALKKRGLTPLIVSKGKFNVLCVGNFPNKKTAESLFVELKKRYRDCLIRRL